MLAADNPNLTRSSAVDVGDSLPAIDDARPSTLVLHSTSSEYSGTTRIAWYVAHGFAQLGHRVTLVFVDARPSNLLLPMEGPKPTVRFLSGRLTKGLSRALQAPVIQIFERGAFDTDDSVDIIRQLVDPSLKQLTESSDYVLLMNQWCGFALLLHPRPRKPLVALLFHEPPVFQELPLPLRAALRFYVKRICQAVDVVVSISPTIQRSLALKSCIDSTALMFAVAPGKVSNVRDNFVLANTRWTTERDPMFVADVVRLVPGVRFIVAGRFANERLKLELERRLKEFGVADQVEVRPNIAEEELATLFSTARCYIRWSAVHGEQGTSLGLFQAIGSGCVPIVSEDIGSAQEVKQEISSNLVVPRTPEGFAAIVNRIMRDDGLFKALQDRVLSYREAHTWKNYAEELKRELDLAKTRVSTRRSRAP